MRLLISIAILVFVSLVADTSAQKVDGETTTEAVPTNPNFQDAKIKPEELTDTDAESDTKHGERAKKHVCTLKCHGGQSGCNRQCGYGSGRRIVALNSMGALGSAGMVGSYQMAVPVAAPVVQPQFGMVAPIQQAPMQVIAPTISQPQYRMVGPSIVQPPMQVVAPAIHQQPIQVVAPQVTIPRVQVVAPALSQPVQVLSTPLIQQQPVQVLSTPQIQQQPVQVLAPPQIQQQPVQVLAPPQVQQQPVQVVSPPQIQQQPVQISAPPQVQQLAQTWTCHLSNGPQPAAQAPVQPPVYMPPVQISSPYAPQAYPTYAPLYGTAPNYFSPGQSILPSFGSPSFGSPSFGSTSFGSTSFGSPSFGSPSFGSPSFGSPSFGSPSFGSPSFGSTSFGSPSFGSPSFGSSYPMYPHWYRPSRCFGPNCRNNHHHNRDGMSSEQRGTSEDLAATLSRLRRFPQDKSEDDSVIPQRPVADESVEEKLRSNFQQSEYTDKKSAQIPAPNENLKPYTKPIVSKTPREQFRPARDYDEPEYM